MSYSSITAFVSASLHGSKNLIGEVDQVQRFIRPRAKNSYYKDSLGQPGEHWNPSAGATSTYGTTQNYFRIDTGVTFLERQSEQRPYMKGEGYIRKPARPKYYFNYQHFGHASDFVQQGKDSAMWQYSSPVGSTGGGTLLVAELINQADTSDSNTPPVVVKFASASNVPDLRTRLYRESVYSTLIAGRPVSTVMYNSSVYATSSIPWIDNTSNPDAGATRDRPPSPF